MMEETQLSFRHLEINRLEAMVEIMFLAAYADGSINEAERAELARHVAAMSEGRLGADLVESLISIIERSVRDEGRSGRFAALRAAPARRADARGRDRAGRPPRGRRRRDPTRASTRCSSRRPGPSRCRSRSRGASCPAAEAR